MCGINGIYAFSSQAPGVTRDSLVAMNAVIEHRGPDDTGVWVADDARIGFGHQRLSILDLSPNGHQPMHTSSGETIVFNGEIYNFQELRKSLGDIHFRSDSDTEVLLNLYARKGKACLDDLNGMFAFAAWSPDEKRLFLARDRIGIKPLYYTFNDGVFAFSSEIRSLLQLPWIRREIDEDALYHFLTFNRLSPPETMFKGIAKFHPGHFMVVSADGQEKYEPFWEIDYASAGQGVPESDLIAALRKSVGYRMVSDVPVGAFLSGGVDSSAIVALMTERASKPVNTYSIGFDAADGYDERQYAKQVAEHFGTNHFERVVHREEIAEFLPRVVEVYDEPLADATSIPMYFISEMARANGSTVVLTGDGADELFCGYRSWLRYLRFLPLYRLALALPRPLRGLLAGASVGLNPNSAISEMFSRAAMDQEFFWGGAGGMKESAKAGILHADFLERQKGSDLHSHVADMRAYFNATVPGGRAGDFTDWMCFVGLKDVVPNFYLYRADRLGMANSIELRVPFLDHEVVNLAMSMRSGLKTRGSEPKSILKKALEPILPHNILYRKKQGFCVPLDEWMGPTIVDYISTRSDDFCASTGYFDPTALRSLMNSAKQGNTDVVHSLWNIYFLMSWHDKWMT